MVLALYQFRVKEGMEEDYLRTTEEKIKPFWERRGCGYSVYRSTEEAGMLLKLMTFPDESSMRNALFEKDEEAKGIVELFKGFVKDLKRSIYTKVL
jgi:quinol monooxygenase YgiN